MQTIPQLLEPADLYHLLGEKRIQIIDLSNIAHFATAHIPGAIHLPLPWLHSSTNKLPEPEQLNQLFQYIQLAPDTHIIAMDDEGGGWAGRLLWTLQICGFHQWSYLNGGIHSWKKEGFPCTDDNVKVTPLPVSIDFTIDASQLTDVEQIMSRINQPNYQLWDARSQEEYDGLRSPAQRAGHIPSAIHCEWTELMDFNRQLRIIEHAKAYILNKGFCASANITTYCQSHHRSGFTWLVGFLCGFNIIGYDGSWQEWGNLSHTPIDNS